VSQLLNFPPFGLRDDVMFLEEINSLTRHHLEGCPLYARVWPDWSAANAVEEVPYLHVAATTGLKRIVSISRMHRFGPVWDGQSYWRQAFEEIEVQLDR
jgi:hypothetical protein